MAKKKIPLQVGDIVQINLENGLYCFGRVLNEPLMAFYEKSSEYINNQQCVQNDFAPENPEILNPERD